ncbi:hypothetical protein ANCDUO_26286 [Ancylostoma duodenale]|uniref:Uncharacterized protein n=1 Tax=Ancylostoma duodenale TaxID=51022 RepID=A0A0C2BIT4_9BILA|nr:hypothetical protein ANCDUO_26286 [Ancylostoma duodenale]
MNCNRLRSGVTVPQVKAALLKWEAKCIINKNILAILALQPSPAVGSITAVVTTMVRTRRKAPECIPLVNDLVSKISYFSSGIEEKRKRSVVIYGIEEANKELPAIERQRHTEAQVEKILDVLNVESRPVEIFRMDRQLEGRPRLVKVVFSSRNYFFDVLRNAHKLRNIPLYNRIYIRQSMTIEERNNDRELREKARELNAKEGGRKTYVVYKHKLVKPSEIGCSDPLPPKTEFHPEFLILPKFCSIKLPKFNQ